MLGLQKALRPLPGDLVHRVDEDHLALASGALLAVADDDARLHRGVVEQVGAQADDGLDPVLLDHLGAHGLFFVTEQHTVWPEHGTTSLGGEAGQDVLLEGVIGAALRRRTQRVTPPLVTAPGLAIPLLDGVRRVGQDHIELTQAVAFDVLGFGQGVTPDDFEVLHAVQEQVHAGDG